MFPPQLVATFATFHADTVHIICDAYSIEPTINDSKRDRRENTEATYSIQGCDQTRPTDFNSTLLSTSFKFALIEFIAYKIRSQHYKDIINEKTVFYTLKQSYIKVQVDNNEVIISGVDELSCSHNEADARYAAENTSSPHIVVRASDTGTFILLFHFASQLDDQIWMHTGSSSLKTRRDIDISTMAIVCATLPGFHVFTGSDYTASFMRIGKVRQFDVMIKNEEFLQTFTRLGHSDIVSSEVSATLEFYVCAFYGQPNSSGVNAARYKIFCKMYASHTGDKPLEKIKSAESCCLSPCKATLQLRSFVLENNGHTAWYVTSWSCMGTWWRNIRCSMVWGTIYTSTGSKWLIRRGYQYWRWTNAPGIIRWRWWLINPKTWLSWQMMYQYIRCLKRYLTWFILINFISTNHLC